MVNNALHQAKQADVELKLTLKEYCVLEYLMRNAGQTVTREQILEHCWDFAFDSFSNIVDVYVKQLRKKLDDTDERYIRTIRSVGYQFQR
jgi:DNA-binding response OmpR family regulator